MAESVSTLQFNLEFCFDSKVEGSNPALPFTFISFHKPKRGSQERTANACTEFVLGMGEIFTFCELLIKVDILGMRAFEICCFTCGRALIAHDLCMRRRSGMRTQPCPGQVKGNIQSICCV